MYSYRGVSGVSTGSSSARVSPYSATVERNVAHCGFPGTYDIPDDDTTKNILRVTSVDYLITSNTKYHHTDEYDISVNGYCDVGETGLPQASMVSRRGQPFNIEVTFNRAFDLKNDDIRLLFEMGSNPLPSKGTRVSVGVSENGDPKCWSLAIKGVEGNKVMLSVRTPATCFVGIWSVSVDTKLKSHTTTRRFTDAPDIFVIFNPWNKDDVVFLSGEDELDEYVMNETGTLYTGTERSIEGLPWFFGQFEHDVLRCAMYLLDKSGLPYSARGDSVYIVRAISSLCNASDNNGVLMGKWQPPYTGGVEPIRWSGSVDILRQYYYTKMPVRFAQCWVYSGIVTTVCRALGIPARSVTNFVSPHNGDTNMTIDTYYDVNGQILQQLTPDYVWNYHMWNEVWMDRPDLSAGYGGWQVIDATPQERSGGIFCCGPAPVLAIKRGEVNVNYDSLFPYTEVNAEKADWYQQSDGTFRCYSSKNSIGKCISTKKKGSFCGTEDREDITLSYKCQGGIVRSDSGTTHTNGTDPFTCIAGDEDPSSSEHDVVFELVDTPDIEYGKPIKAHVKMHNKGNDKRTVNLDLCVFAVCYTGHQGLGIKRERNSITLLPNDYSEKVMYITWEDYWDETVEHPLVNIKCMAEVSETKQSYVSSDTVLLKRPVLRIECLDTVTVGVDIEVTFRFVNPLDIPLTKCNLQVSGPGLQKTLSVMPGNVAARMEFYYKMTITSRKVCRKGRPRELVGKFSCRQIGQINGIKPIKILN